MRRHGRIDDNQAHIVTALRAIGCSVQSISALGHGVPDLLVGLFGRTYILEVKDGDKPPSARKLTADEKRWHETWRGAPVIVVNSVDEALAAVNAHAI